MAVSKFLAATCLSLGLAFSGAAAKAETLADALTLAYNNSGLLEQNRALLRAADENVAQAVAGLRPILNWSASVRRSFGTSYSLQQRRAVGTGTTDATIAVIGELLIYDSGKTRLGVDAAKESVLSTRQELISVEQGVLLRAATAYIGVLSGAESVQLRQNNLRLLRQELRAARDRFEVGEVTRTDVALAEARLASARAALAGAQGELDRAKEEYRAVVGRAPGSLQPITRLPDLETNEERAKLLAVRSHPDLRAVQFAINAAEIAIKRAEADRGATVKLEGRLNMTQRYDSDFFNEGGEIGITATGPIYQGGRLTSLQRQAMARRDAERANLYVVQDRIRQEVGNALAGLRIANSAIGATRQQISAAQTAFRGVREEARLGQRTTLDVLTAEQDLLDARTQLTDAIADRNRAAFQLLAAQGFLTADRLGLPVQRYDPVEYYKLIKNAPAISREGDKLDRVLKKLGKQ